RRLLLCGVQYHRRRPRIRGVRLLRLRLRKLAFPNLAFPLQLSEDQIREHAVRRGPSVRPSLTDLSERFIHRRRDREHALPDARELLRRDLVQHSRDLALSEPALLHQVGDAARPGVPLHAHTSAQGTVPRVIERSLLALIAME